MTTQLIYDVIRVGAWTLLPLIVVFAGLLVRGAPSRRPWRGLVLLGLVALTYAHLIEPRILWVRRHDLTIDRCLPAPAKLRVGLVADLHIGAFRNAMSLRRIRAALRAAQVDAVLIAGDFVYHLEVERFDAAFEPLADMGVPVLFVLGNHDVGLPGPNVQAPLERALTRLGLIDVTHRSQIVETDFGRFEVVGISDQWQGLQRFDGVRTSTSVPRLVLTHHPETLYLMPDDAQFDLLVAGHTHGGQIYIPGLTCRWVSFACLVTREGAFSRPEGEGFVTAGTGMVGLPVRLGVPPRVDVLEVTSAPCP